MYKREIKKLVSSDNVFLRNLEFQLGESHKKPFHYFLDGRRVEEFENSVEVSFSISCMPEDVEELLSPLLAKLGYRI